MRGCNGGGYWHTLFSSSVMHDSLLKENRHFMQPSQAFINKTPWVAVYPAFFVNPMNVYQTWGVSQSGFPLWSSTTTPPHHGNLQLWHGSTSGLILGSKAKHYPAFNTGPVGGITVIHSRRGCCYPYRTWRFTCDSRPGNKPQAFLHAQHGHNLNCAHGSTISCTHTHAEVEISRDVNTK